MGTKTNPGEFDCYAKALPDEPLFTLLARDKRAPGLIWLWAALTEMDGTEPEKAMEARQLVDDMIAWQAAHKRKPVGLGACVLVGVMDMIRMANHFIAKSASPGNTPTPQDVLYHALVKSRFDFNVG